MTYQTMQERIAHPSLCNIALCWLRPKAGDFAKELEYTHYPPGTARNEKLEFSVLKWLGLPWNIITIPAEDRGKAEEVAARWGFRLVKGIPLEVGNGKTERFPIAPPNLFVLQGAPRMGESEDLALARALLS